MGSEDEQGALYRGMYPEAGAMTPERLDFLRKDLGRFKIEYGGETRPEAVEKRFNPEGNSVWDLAGSVGHRLAIEPLEAAVRVGDALRGKSQYVVDEINDPKTVTAAMVSDVMQGVGIAGGPQIAKGAFSSKVPSARTLGVFGGVGAKEAPLRMRDIAEKALAAGKDPDEVWKWTGWKPGMEGKMRFEIDDRAMALTPYAKNMFQPQKGTEGLYRVPANILENEHLYLKEFIDNPELFKQYPEIKDMIVRFDHKGKGASFDEANMVFHLPREGVMLGQQNSYLDSITHEIQHWVQSKEGFARGGSPEMFSTPIKREISTYDRDLKILDDKIQHYKEYMGRFDPEYDRERLEQVGETLVGLMDERKQIEKYARNATKELIESPFKYQNLAGEIEARDAAARRTWDTDMRRAVPPDMRKDAIVRTR